MSDYLFVQSQDPFTEVRTAGQYALASQLATAGHCVTLYLVQNGVTCARRGAVCDAFDRLAEQGVTIVADDFSLEQREIGADQLKSRIQVEEISAVIDALLAGQKVIWN